MGGSDNAEDRTGLWIYDLDKAKAQKVLSGPITAASWAPDGTKLTFSLGAPFSEVWVARLDPNTSSIEALGGGRTLPEHYREMVEHYTRVIEADPADAESYRRRAQYYDLLHDDEEARADVDMYAAILSSSAGEGAHDRWIRDLLVTLLRSTPSDHGSKVNSPHGGACPCISIDGLSLYFSSLEPGGHGRGDIWKVVRPTTDDSWGTSENLGATVNSLYDDKGPSLSADELSLYFHSDRPGGSGRKDLWVSTRANTSDSWGVPENLGRRINSSREDIAPSISADDLSLFFGSNRPGGYGHFDIWVTTRKSKRDQWGSPVNLGPRVNSADLDDGPYISSDGRILFFHSFRPGQYGWLDIWVAGRETTDGQWSEPVNLGPTINGRYGDVTPSMSADGSTLFFASGLRGDWDLWQVPINPIPGAFLEDSNESTRITVERSDEKEVAPQKSP
jgi:Tol biopolymer transport system component